jgi:membrane associated rhomboid family serine protease
MQRSAAGRLRDSPSVLISSILVIIYLVLGVAGGNLLAFNYELFLPLAQVNTAVWQGAVWMLFTAMFIHANLAHLGGNLLFLLIFGTSLEEQVPRKKWLATYFSSGLAGNIAFLFLGGDAIGLGASGAIWGLLGAAGGLKGLIGMVFFLGLDLFSGGGFLAHASGLIVGLTFRYFWFNKSLRSNARAK